MAWLFGTSAKKVLKKCAELNAELSKLPYDLRVLRKTDPKTHDDIEKRLRDTVESIGEALKEITLPGSVVNELVKFRDTFSNLRKRFF